MDCSVHGSFLVGGGQYPDRMLNFSEIHGVESFGYKGKKSFHVNGTETVQPSVANFSLKRW